MHRERVVCGYTLHNLGVERKPLVSPVLTVVGLSLRGQLHQRGLSRCTLTGALVFLEVGDGYAGQDTHQSQCKHDFDECETALWLQHGLWVKPCSRRVLGTTDEVGVFRMGLAHIRRVVMGVKMAPQRRCLWAPFADGAALDC